MYVQFDERNMHVQVIVGTLEVYTPSEEIKAINDRVAALKEQMVKFQQEVVFPELQAVKDLVDKANNVKKEEQTL